MNNTKNQPSTHILDFTLIDGNPYKLKVRVDTIANDVLYIVFHDDEREDVYGSFNIALNRYVVLSSTYL